MYEYIYIWYVYPKLTDPVALIVWCLVVFIVMPFPDRLGKRSAFVAMRGSQILPLGLKLSCALRADFFFHAELNSGFSDKQKAYVGFTVFKKLISSWKTFDVWRYRYRTFWCCELATPQRTQPRDFPTHRDLFTLHGDWRCGEFRCRSEGPSGYLGQCTIAWWSKWKYEFFFFFFGRLMSMILL